MWLLIIFFVVPCVFYWLFVSAGYTCCGQNTTYLTNHLGHLHKLIGNSYMQSSRRMWSKMFSLHIWVLSSSAEGYAAVVLMPKSFYPSHQPMMDRTKAAELPKLQCGFIDFVCTFVYKVNKHCIYIFCNVMAFFVIQYCNLLYYAVYYTVLSCPTSAHMNNLTNNL